MVVHLPLAEKRSESPKNIDKNTAVGRQQHLPAGCCGDATHMLDCPSLLFHPSPPSSTLPLSPSLCSSRFLFHPRSSFTSECGQRPLREHQAMIRQCCRCGEALSARQDQRRVGGCAASSAHHRSSTGKSCRSDCTCVRRLHGHYQAVTAGLLEELVRTKARESQLRAAAQQEEGWSAGDVCARLLQLVKIVEDDLLAATDTDRENSREGAAPGSPLQSTSSGGDTAFFSRSSGYAGPRSSTAASCAADDTVTRRLHALSQRVWRVEEELGRRRPTSGPCTTLVLVCYTTLSTFYLTVMAIAALSCEHITFALYVSVSVSLLLYPNRAAALPMSTPTTLCVQRLMADLQNLRKDPPETFDAGPDPKNILRWCFVFDGAPDTPFQGGRYVGKINFDPNFPLKPPEFLMLTPNGRFVINQPICMSNTSFHPEQWSPIWSIRTMILGFIAFMNTESSGIGAVVDTPLHRQQLAAESRQYNVRHLRHIYATALPEAFAKDSEAVEAASAAEASTDSGTGMGSASKGGSASDDGSVRLIMGSFLFFLIAKRMNEKCRRMKSSLVNQNENSKKTREGKIKRNSRSRAIRPALFSL
eukprot:gene11090-7718_t